jgi:hypothetical protein
VRFKIINFMIVAFVKFSTLKERVNKFQSALSTYGFQFCYKICIKITANNAVGHFWGSKKSPEGRPYLLMAKLNYSTRVPWNCMTFGKEKHHGWLFVLQNGVHSFQHCSYTWFQTFDVFWMLYSFFWVIPWGLNFMCRSFGTLCLVYLRRRCK